MANYTQRSLIIEKFQVDRLQLHKYKKRFICSFQRFYLTSRRMFLKYTFCKLLYFSNVYTSKTESRNKIAASITRVKQTERKNKHH